MYVAQNMGQNALLGYGEQANVSTFCIQGGYSLDKGSTSFLRRTVAGIWSSRL